jgi:hypothetical protein
MALKSLDRAALGELLFLFPDLENVAFAEQPAASGYGSPTPPYLRRRQAVQYARTRVTSHKMRSNQRLRIN